MVNRCWPSEGGAGHGGPGPGQLREQVVRLAQLVAALTSQQAAMRVEMNVMREDLDAVLADHAEMYEEMAEHARHISRLHQQLRRQRREATGDAE